MINETVCDLLMYPLLTCEITERGYLGCKKAKRTKYLQHGNNLPYADFSLCELLVVADEDNHTESVCDPIKLPSNISIHVAYM